MTLNPITALSEQLQKLINEHGSASILRDHLALFKDQVVLLEKENAKLSSENAILMSKVTVLEERNQDLVEESEKLRSKIHEYAQPHGSPLEDIKVKTFVFLARQPDKLTAEQIAMAITVQITTFHLQELTDKRMIHDMLAMGRPRRWYLGHEGRRYLIDRKLISSNARHQADRSPSTAIPPYAERSR